MLLQTTVVSSGLLLLSGKNRQKWFITNLHPISTILRCTLKSYTFHLTVRDNPSTVTLHVIDNT